MRNEDKHDYLGIKLLGVLVKRGGVILESRIRSVWAKIQIFRNALLNKHVNIKLRLRLFDSVVTPCPLYGLSIAPITKQKNHSLGAKKR